MGSALLSFEKQVAQPRPARLILYQGGLFTVHVDSTDTAGQFALLEVEGAPGGEPPLHVHKNEDEMFYVLEGQLKVRRGEEELTADAGDSVFLPRGVAHTFKILSKAARFLVYITPGGFESYFRELGHPVDGMHAGKVEKVPIAEILRVAGRYGVTFMP
jgi:quercetin dioxygenase-like cupin family protein